MALTTPRGFAGGPMADIDYGIGSAGGAWVESAGGLAVTQPNTATRTVSIAAGNGAAFGVRVTNDAALSQALAAPGSGGAWYLLALRYNWSAKTVTLQALPGPTTGATTTPTDVPATLPATMTSTPGTSFDQPLAWAFVNSANTTITLFDLRIRSSWLDQLAAATPQALAVSALQNPPLSGITMPCLSNGATYRWNGTKWVLWDLGPIGALDLFDLPADVGYWNDQGISEGNVSGGVLYINLATYSNNAQNFGTTFATLKAAYRPGAPAWGAGQALSGIDANAEAVASYIALADGTIKVGRAGNASGSISRANAHRLSMFFRLP